MNKEKISNILLLAFFVSIPTQLGYFFWPEGSLVLGVRIDYLAIKLFLSDLLLLVLFLFDVKKLKTILISNKTLLLFFLVFALLNSINSEIPIISIYKWIKVFEVTLLAIYVSKLNRKSVHFALIGLVIGILLAIIAGYLQFFLQESINGAFYYLGERSFTSTTPGIATVNVFGLDYLRSYSTFPHPNAFAGFIVVSIFLFYELLVTSKAFKYILYSLMAIALILTFSRTAIAVFVATIFLKAVHLNKQRAILLVSVFMSLLMPIVATKVETDATSIQRRIDLAEIAGKQFSESPLFGKGIGNSLVDLPNKYLLMESRPATWWIQPVHNIYLLLLVDTGLVGLVLFTTIVQKIIATEDERSYIFLPVILTGFADHYWLTLQQNIILASVVAGLLINRNIGTKK